MRILTTTLFLLVGATVFAQLPNSGFENWTTHTIYEEPNPWETGNQEGDSVVVWKSTDAQHATYSVKMQTKIEANGDTTFGYVLMGDPGGNGPSGFPCTNAPDSMVGYYKCDVKTGDTALVLCAPTFANNPTGQGVFAVTGVQSTWTRFSIPITYGVKICDSVTVAAASSNALGAFQVNGSWLMLDNLQLKSAGTACAIPGYSFETWTPLTYEDPDSWGSLNKQFAQFGIGGDTIVTQTSDANSGSYAVKLTTSVFGPDTAYALMSLGGWDLNNNAGIGIPFTLQYAYLNGYYKSTPAVSSDSAAIQFEAFNSGTSLGQDAMQLPAQASYTGFSLPLTYSSAPDTVTVIFYPGDADGSVAYFDDIQLSAWPVFVEDNLQQPVKVYPNPAADFITIEGLNSGSITLYDVNGRIALSATHQFNQTVDVSSLAAGVYVIEVRNETNQVVNKQKIAVH